MSATATPPLREKFIQAGQGQVFAFWGQLDEGGRRALLEQAGEINLAEVTRLTRLLLGKDAAPGVDLTDLQPAPYVARPENGGEAAEWARARAAGEAALRAGRVAAFTVAPSPPIVAQSCKCLKACL